MAQNTKPAAQKPEDPAVKKKSGNKPVMIIAAVVLLLAAGGAGWYFTKGKADATHTAEVKAAPPKTPIFLALEPFTVNLLRESSDQYLQLGLSLKYFDPEIEEKIKLNLPEIRSKILQLLTTKTATELLTTEGKNKLTNEILALSNAVIGIVNAPAPVAGLHALAQPSAASQVGAAPETQPEAQANSAASAPATGNPAAPAHVEKKGIVDVLFTSFIIQ